MLRFFKPSEEFGWSELISTCAFILSIISLTLYVVISHQVNSASIYVSTLPARAYHVCDHDLKEWRVIAIVPFRFTNTGGRSTTLTEISKDRNLAPVIGISDENEHFEVWNNLVLLESLVGHQIGRAH